jgi:hypothetical protein
VIELAIKEDSVQEQGVIEDGLNNLAMIALYNAFQTPLLCSFGANARYIVTTFLVATRAAILG